MLAELKAAGVDVAAKQALAHGKQVVFLDNIPVPLEGELDSLIEKLAQDVMNSRKRA